MSSVHEGEAFYDLFYKEFLFLVWEELRALLVY